MFGETAMSRPPSTNRISKLGGIVRSYKHVNVLFSAKYRMKQLVLKYKSDHTVTNGDKNHDKCTEPQEVAIYEFKQTHNGTYDHVGYDLGGT